MVSATVTPFPAANPSAFTTRGRPWPLEQGFRLRSGCSRSSSPPWVCPPPAIRALAQLFAGLQLGPVGSWPEHGDPTRPQGVGQAVGERPFRPDHHQGHPQIEGRLEQALLVGVVDGQGLTALQLGGSAIAWSHPDPLHPRATGQGPGQGVLPAAGAHHQQSLHAGLVGGRGTGLDRSCHGAAAAEVADRFP
jgi:hypothetical protein